VRALRDAWWQSACCVDSVPAFVAFGCVERVVRGGGGAWGVVGCCGGTLSVCALGPLGPCMLVSSVCAVSATACSLVLVWDHVTDGPTCLIPVWTVMAHCVCVQGHGTVSRRCCTQAGRQASSLDSGHGCSTNMVYPCRRDPNTH
jgi:hypothetical protein